MACSSVGWPAVCQLLGPFAFRPPGLRNKNFMRKHAHISHNTSSLYKGLTDNEIMWFSESEIETLVLIAGAERVLYPADLSRALNLRPETLSRIVTRLVNKSLLERKDREIALARTPAAESFKRLYFSHRASPFSLLFADRRIDLLSRIESGQKSVQVLEEETAIPKETIYRYLKKPPAPGRSEAHQERQGLSLFLE